MNTQQKVLRQPALLLHDLCLEVLNVDINDLLLFWAKAFPRSGNGSDKELKRSFATPH